MLHCWLPHPICIAVLEHGGPNTPNSVSAENLAQASIDVDGNYPEEANEHDYSLFQEQGTPFMPG